MTLLGAVALGKALAFFSIAILGHTLGSAQLGIYGTATTFLGFGLILTNFGLESIGIRELGERRGSLRQVGLRVLGLRSALAVVMGIATIVVARGAGWRLTVAIPFALIPVAYATRLDWVLLASDRPRMLAGASVARDLAFLLLVIGVVTRMPNVDAAAWALLGAELTHTVLTHVAAPLRRGVSQDPGVKSRRGYLRDAMPLVVMGVLSLTNSKIDTPLIAHLRGLRDAGYYFAAYSILFGVLNLAAPLARAAFPEMARQRVDNQDLVEQGMLKLSLLSGIAGAMLALGLHVMAAPAMQLVYGSGFKAGADALSILAWSLVPTFMSGVLTQGLVALDRQRWVAGSAGVSAVVNVCMNLVLIPRLGIVGAACATIASESALLIVVLWVIRDISGAAMYLRRLVWVFAALLAAGGLAAKLTVFPEWAILGIAGCAFCSITAPVLMSLLRDLAGSAGVVRSA